jgi:hypothetical protein
MYKEDVEAARQQLADQQEQTRLEALFLAWFRKHREIVACDATKNVVIAWFNGDEITWDALEESYPILVAKKIIPLQTEAQERRKILAEIFVLQKERMSSDSYEGWSKVYRQQLHYKSTEQLRHELDQLQNRREMAQMSKKQLAALVRTNIKRSPEPPADLTRESILFTAKTDREGFKALVARWGSSALNKILQGEN